MVIFNSSLVIHNFDAQDAESVIEALANRLYVLGLTRNDYGRATIEREKIHPTGLPTKPFCIAFPHSDSEGVFQSALAIASLQNPVNFKNMADPDEDLPVLLVFMLANKSAEEQIQTLRNLATLFGQPEKLTELRDQKTSEQVAGWIKRELRLDQRGG